jgi:hypothetical protein
MNLYKSSPWSSLTTLLLVCLITVTSCKKDPPPPPPLDLALTMMGNWYADLVTQSDIDITATSPFAFNIDNDSTCVVERMWLGEKKLFVCNYTIDEDNDRFLVEHLGADKWNIAWKVMTADIEAGQVIFKDERATADTYIHLFTW